VQTVADLNSASTPEQEKIFISVQLAAISIGSFFTLVAVFFSDRKQKV
jgi:hypothetical protein